MQTIKITRLTPKQVKELDKKGYMTGEDFVFVFNSTSIKHSLSEISEVLAKDSTDWKDEPIIP